MPTPGQMAAGQQSTIPRELLEQMPQQRGAIMGAGHGLAATVNGELIDYVYLRSEFPDFDGDSESVMELLDSPLIGPTVRRLQALGSVHVGMISCWEFVEL